MVHLKALFFGLSILGSLVYGQIDVPLEAVGPVVGAQTLNGQSFLFYQDCCTGDIVMRAVSNGFTVPASTTNGFSAVVPGSQVLWGTPIAVAQRASQPNEMGELGLYFFSQNRTLNEYRYTQNTVPPWNGGPTCETCIDKQNYVVEQNSNILYAMGSVSGNAKVGVRVGFISADHPDTLSEANRAAGVWSLATMPL
ncbi:hypothetical protein VNI00_015070 [Paramarasmius palmivorus]|uniref:Cellobiose dehydrogenase cytochrome domain-containing protein n=1 Tax=Paramarasmius palmivorus TaxID=297713 RepID=A0AAW0BPF8_9AGAR